MNNIEFRKEGNLAFITVSRPKALNALNLETLTELNEVINILKQDQDIYCVLINGTGEKAFVAGADISQMKDMNESEARIFGETGNKIFKDLENLPMPTIAAINGYALGGGCELAMCCDIRIAATNAAFGQPEVSLGIIPGFGGTQRLSKIVGIAKAKEMIYTGAIIKAQEALEIGLVNKLVPVESLMEEAIAMANKIASNAPLAIRACKVAINEGALGDINKGISCEVNEFSKCFNSQDQKDAMTAYLDKKKLEKFSNK